MELLRLTELEKAGPRGKALQKEIDGYLDANEAKRDAQITRPASTPETSNPSGARPRRNTFFEWVAPAISLTSKPTPPPPPPRTSSPLINPGVAHEMTPGEVANTAPPPPPPLPFVPGSPSSLESTNTPSDAESASTVTAGSDSGQAIAEQTGDMLARALGAAAGLNLPSQRIAALERTTRRLLERCSQSKGSALTQALCTAERVARVPLPAHSQSSLSFSTVVDRMSFSHVSTTAPLALAGGGSGGGGLNGLASPTGNGHTVPATTDATAYATIVDLAPDAFRCVRLAFGYTFEAFAESLGSAPLIPVGAGGGRSGASFYYSHDKLFVVKTLPEPEKVFLLMLLSSYVDHMCTHAAYTLLPRFLGLYKVRWVSKLSSVRASFSYIEWTHFDTPTRVNGSLRPLHISPHFVHIFLASYRFSCRRKRPSITSSCPIYFAPMSLLEWNSEKCST